MENNAELIAQCVAKAEKWLTPSFDESTRADVQAMLDKADKTDLIECFYKDLEFGTGGLRGIMGAGSNRMNIYTVGMATQGFANYLKKNFAQREEIAVVVCHDCRNNSRLFAETVADIFSANGIKVYLFDDMRPTPECSFAIRHLGCQAGVNITASHNPREYNGYKAYWEDGAQVLAPHDTGIIDEVNKVQIEDVKFEGNKALIQIIGEDIDKVYLEEVKTLSIDPEVIKRQHDLKIVYTPLHGTGMAMIPRSLKAWGFDNVHCVEEQMVKSGDFPTVKSPNPENGEALTLALRDAKELDADIVMASDPDADRVGMACKNDKGEWILINGNQTCLIFLYYIITNRIKTGKMQPTDFIVKTIVTTEVIRKIAEKQHIEMRDCYTGFKWIAREIALSEGKQKYIGGGEESYGFLAEDFVRDKDAVSACSLLAEICAYAKDQGKTLYDLLMDIYLEYGFSKEFTVNVVRPGKSGADEIKAMMTRFRENPPAELGGSKVVLWKDYQTLEQKAADGTVTKLDMPGEESYGFLAEDFVRDKDAVSACSLLAEICAYAKDQGKTLYDLLMDIYLEYGFSKEFTVNVVRPGKSGADEIKAMMTRFRENPPAELGGSKVVLWKDYQTLEQKAADGTVTKLDMPATSNVLQWFCDDNTKVSVRPSGTEPKIKFYLEVKGTMKCAGCYTRCDAEATEKIAAIEKDLGIAD